jgi:choline-glycine betaine transporter
MSKVFRDFFKIKSMNKGIIIGIPIAIAIIAGIIAITVMLEGDSNDMEVEDTFDKEISPEETPQVGEKLEEIKKIAEENEYDVLAREWQTSGPFQVDRSE